MDKCDHSKRCYWNETSTKCNHLEVKESCHSFQEVENPQPVCDRLVDCNWNDSTEQCLENQGTDFDCFDMKEEQTCQSAPECSWVEDRQKCISPDDVGIGCNEVNEKLVCDEANDCTWVDRTTPEADTCEDTPSQCEDIANDQEFCEFVNEQGILQCTVSSGMCVETPQDCLTISEKPFCIDVKSCTWVEGGDLSLCVETPSSECSGMNTEILCEAVREQNNLDCIWDDGECIDTPDDCLIIGTNEELCIDERIKDLNCFFTDQFSRNVCVSCMELNDEFRCNLFEVQCEYDMSLGECRAVPCSTITDETDCTSANPQCVWDSENSICNAR